jgi:SAM-dependent methyltransferase
MPEQTQLDGRSSHEELDAETRRVYEVYKQRRTGANPSDPRLALYKRCVVDEREELLIRAFQKRGLHTLTGKRILDVGCGGGSLIRHLFDFGAEPDLCFGVDLYENHVSIAKRLTPAVGFVVGNAAQLPFPDETFDVVFQFMVFTSALNPKIRRAIASEILRTLRREGLFVWYDLMYDNPRNPNVKGIGRSEIRKLLPGCRLRFWRVTLAPPIGRVAARFSPFLYQLLAQLPWLRTHCLCLAEKQ